MLTCWQLNSHIRSYGFRNVGDLESNHLAKDIDVYSNDGEYDASWKVILFSVFLNRHRFKFRKQWTLPCVHLTINGTAQEPSHRQLILVFMWNTNIRMKLPTNQVNSFNEMQVEVSIWVPNPYPDRLSEGWAISFTQGTDVAKSKRL
jgi:hypothetical protein